MSDSRAQMVTSTGLGFQQTDASAMMRYDANKRSTGVAYLIWFFLGMAGGHRFYLRRTASAVTMLILFMASLALMVVAIGFLGLTILVVWALIDAVLIPGMVQGYNNRLISEMRM